MKTSSKTQQKVLKTIIIFSIIGLTSILALFAGFLIKKTLYHNTVYSGVYINDFNAEGLTLDELIIKLRSYFSDNLNSKNITITYKGSTHNISLKDLKVNYDIEAIAKKAYSINRDGNILSEISSMFNASDKKISLDLLFSYDKTKAEEVFSQMDKKYLQRVKEHELIIKYDSVILKSGHSGLIIDRGTAFKAIENSLKYYNFSPIDVKTTTVEPASINIDDFYKEINKDPQDAKFVAKGKTFEIKEHIDGRSIEKPVLESFIREAENTTDTEIVIPVVYKQPEVTTEKLNQNLFKDTLKSFSTSFSTSSKNDSNRAVNIRLAANKINGIVLAPGDIFSFNNIVGMRTSEGGYQVAHTYVSGKVVDSVGGGICQVSTTLYNAVLLSDLEVVTRTNHQFVVHYVDFGRDAAVSYPDVDFRFKNSTKWPLRINCSVSQGNVITFTIIGKNDNTNKTVTTSSKTIKVIPRSVNIIEDPTLNEGVTIVKRNGDDGYIIDTYKVVKIDDKVISKKKIHTSNYRPLSKEVYKGTKK